MKELYVGFLLLLLSFLYLSRLNAEYARAERIDRLERMAQLQRINPVLAAKIFAQSQTRYSRM